MDMNAYIDIYCERTQQGLMAEPLNAVTNLAFVFAAWLCWRLYGQKGAQLDKSGAFLMGMVGVIGIGSGLFHTYATRWAMFADVIPIVIFINAFLYFAMRRFFNQGVWSSSVTVVAFFGLSALAKATVPNEVLNGSAGYVPPFAALTAMGGALLVRKHPHADLMLIASAVFAASLMFRSIDQMVCGAVPFGTHFLWHTLNGVSLYLVGKVYLCSWKPQTT